MYFFVYTLEGGAWAYTCDCGSQGMLWVFSASHLIFVFVFVCLWRSGHWLARIHHVSWIGKPVSSRDPPVFTSLPNAVVTSVSPRILDVNSSSPTLYQLSYPQS